MKKTIYLLTIISIVVYACGDQAKTPLAAKKAELDSLQKEMTVPHARERRGRG